MTVESVLAGLTRADRFFARLLSFDLECPYCGDVYQVRTGLARKKGRPAANWDPLTARFSCSNKECHRVYVLGVVAWPMVRGAATQPPEDQIPSPRQLAQLRKEGGGWWMSDLDRQRFARPHTTNLTTEEGRVDHGDEDED